jgi:arylsulfatase
VSQVGPFDRWPSDEGFAHAYTFMAADVHQFIPVMWDDHHPEPYRKTEHLDKDLADRAIAWITGHKSLDKELPFMMLWASGSMHSPHHAPDEYIAKYKGKFDMGCGTNGSCRPSDWACCGDIKKNWGTRQYINYCDSRQWRKR